MPNGLTDDKATYLAQMKVICGCQLSAKSVYTRFDEPTGLHFPSFKSLAEKENCRLSKSMGTAAERHAPSRMVRRVTMTCIVGSGYS